MTRADRKALDVALDRILTGFRCGTASADDTRSVFAHLICAAASGDEREVRGWLQPGALDIRELGSE